MAYTRFSKETASFEASSSTLTSMTSTMGKKNFDWQKQTRPHADSREELSKIRQEIRKSRVQFSFMELLEEK